MKIFKRKHKIFIKRKLKDFKMSNLKNTLLIGGSGNLGSEIIRSKIFKNIYVLDFATFFLPTFFQKSFFLSTQNDWNI